MNKESILIERIDLGVVNGIQTWEIIDPTTKQIIGYDQRESDEEYQATLVRLQKQEAIEYLNSTDYISVQWQDEVAMNIEHNRTEEEYQEILLKRQDARELLREHKDVL